MGKSWVLGMVTLTMVLCLIGLLGFTLGSVHSVAQPGRALTGAPSTVTPPVEPETGPMVDGNGLMLTY
jgi:hypothetical protein